MTDFPKPKKVKAVDRNIVQMTFPLVLEPEEWMPGNGKYLIGGGIAWPSLMNMRSGFHGYALVCGISLETKKAYIFEEKNFSSIDHVVENDMVEKKGICSWWNAMYDKYYCKIYYHHENKQTHKKYMLQSVKSRMVAEPKPIFINAKWADDNQAMQNIWERAENNKLHLSDVAGLFRAIRHYKIEAKDIPQELMALISCIVGMGGKREVL